MECENNEISSVIRFPPEVQEVIDKVLILIVVIPQEPLTVAMLFCRFFQVRTP